MALYKLDEFSLPSKGTCLCLGMFDGVHLGHAQLIAHCVHTAKEKGLTPCAFTFDVPPAAVLNPDKPLKMLTDIHEKSDILHSLGLEHVIYAHFDASIAHLSAVDFAKSILFDKLNMAHGVIGFHYRFGFKAQGNASLLENLCAQYGSSLTVVPPVTLPDGTLISSTAIRSALENGDFDFAEKMLGRALSQYERNLTGGIDHA